MYSYENYAKVKAEIESRRTSAIAMADAHSEQMRQMSDEIARIDAELSGTGLLLFKTACSGGDITPIKERNQALVKLRRELIVGLGYPADYTDVHYSCKLCSDSGFVDTRMCSCFKEALVRATIESSGIGHLIDEQTFENFDLDWYNDNPSAREKMALNLASAKSYVKNVPKSKGNLLLIGSTGT